MVSWTLLTYAQIASDFKSNPLAVWNGSDSNHVNFSCDSYPLVHRFRGDFACDFAGTLRFKSLRFETASIPILRFGHLGLLTYVGQENKYIHFERDGVRDKRYPSLGQTEIVPGTTRSKKSLRVLFIISSLPISLYDKFGGRGGGVKQWRQCSSWRLWPLPVWHYVIAKSLNKVEG